METKIERGMSQLNADSRPLDGDDIDAAQAVLAEASGRFAFAEPTLASSLHKIGMLLQRVLDQRGVPRHTPARAEFGQRVGWRAFPDGTIYAENATIVAQAEGFRGTPIGANAERIAACVNACANLPLHALPRITLAMKSMFPENIDPISTSTRGLMKDAPPTVADAPEALCVLASAVHDMSARKPDLANQLCKVVDLVNVLRSSAPASERGAQSTNVDDVCELIASINGIVNEWEAGDLAGAVNAARKVAENVQSRLPVGLSAEVIEHEGSFVILNQRDRSLASGELGVMRFATRAFAEQQLHCMETTSRAQIADRQRHGVIAIHEHRGGQSVYRLRGSFTEDDFHTLSDEAIVGVAKQFGCDFDPDEESLSFVNDDEPIDIELSTAARSAQQQRPGL